MLRLSGSLGKGRRHLGKVLEITGASGALLRHGFFCIRHGLGGNLRLVAPVGVLLMGPGTGPGTNGFPQGPRHGFGRPWNGFGGLIIISCSGGGGLRIDPYGPGPYETGGRIDGR